MIETRSTKKIESINRFIVCVPPISATVDHCCAFSTIGNRAVLTQIHIRPPLLTLIPWSSTQGTECFWAHLEQSNCRTALRALRALAALRTRDRFHQSCKHSTWATALQGSSRHLSPATLSEQRKHVSSATSATAEGLSVAGDGSIGRRQCCCCLARDLL